MVTPLAFETTMPSRPAPPLVSWSEGLDGQGWLAVPLLPSMMTPFRSRPRRCRFGFWIQTPALGHWVLFSWYTPGQIRIQSPGLAALTASCTVEKIVPGGPGGHGLVLPLHTSSTFGPLCAEPAPVRLSRAPCAVTASAWLPAIAGAPASISVQAAPASHQRLIMVLPSTRPGLPTMRHSGP